MKQLLITAGPTREALDDVRFFSNRATGQLGILIAEAAIARGFQTTLVLGPTHLRPSNRAIDVVPVESAQEMFEAVKARFSQSSAFIASAAVADYRPKQRLAGKLKKQEGDLVLELERTPDILLWAAEHRRPEQVLIGFALEADPDPKLAEAKLQRKRCDYLVHNSPANFGTGGGQVRLLDRQGVRFSGEPTKPELAALILDLLATHETS